MAVKTSVIRLVAQKSGNRCAMCRRSLSAPAVAGADAAILGDVAHIVGESINGPRGTSLLTLDERNSEPNLLLLCNVDHQRVDAQPEAYSVEKLKAIKAEHEEWVDKVLGRGIDQSAPAPVLQTDRIHSTIFAVEQMPRFIYSAPTSAKDDAAARERADYSKLKTGVAAPFVIKEQQLHAFQDLRQPSPFSNLIDARKVTRTNVAEWWDDPLRLPWFMTLGNRALHRLAVARGLEFDHLHGRHFFPMEKKGEAREVSYRPLNQKTSTRSVVWQPKVKKTGEARNYWYHLAVNLRLLKTGARSWVLAIRPELRITKDGFEPYASEYVGAKITRLMSRDFNYDVLSDVNFWRDFLAAGSPRMLVPFDKGQLLSISSTLMSASVTWPGLPEEFAKPFKNVEYEDDLLSWAPFAEFLADDEVEDADREEAEGEDEAA